MQIRWWVGEGFEHGCCFLAQNHTIPILLCRLNMGHAIDVLTLLQATRMHLLQWKKNAMKKKMFVAEPQRLSKNESEYRIAGLSLVTSRGTAHLFWGEEFATP